MSLQEYGVWTGRAVRVSAETAQDDPQSPHIHLFYDDGTGGQYEHARRASINVKSASALSELVVWIDLDFNHPITENLAGLAQGFTRLESTVNNGIALDYIRGNLVDLKVGRVLPHDVPGVENDVLDLVLPLLQTAVQRQATVHIFGEPYLPDRQGIHDVHMNQGSVGSFTKYNGVWQDGGLFIKNSNGSYTAILFAFASQAAHTDELRGNPLPGSSNLNELITGSSSPVTPAIQDDRRVALIGALVNPIGPENTPQHEGESETVWLMNCSPDSVAINGWTILNKNENAQRIDENITLSPGQFYKVLMDKAPLSNSGGLLTLLDENGVKLDGVSYTREQAGKEGYVVIFR